MGSLNNIESMEDVRKLMSIREVCPDCGSELIDDICESCEPRCTGGCRL